MQYFAYKRHGDSICCEGGVKITYATNKPFASVTIKLSTSKISARLKQKRENEKINISLGDALVHATAISLKAFPELNSNYKKKIILFDSINVGYLINVGKGSEMLLIRNANKLSIEDTAKYIKENVMEYLREKKIETGEPTIAITNLSPFNTFLAIPPIYANNSCTLAIASEFDETMNLTLSFDSQPASMGGNNG